MKSEKVATTEDIEMTDISLSDQPVSTRESIGGESYAVDKNTIMVGNVRCYWLNSIGVPRITIGPTW
jgi:hypothetical protein